MAHSNIILVYIDRIKSIFLKSEKNENLAALYKELEQRPPVSSQEMVRIIGKKHVLTLISEVIRELRGLKKEDRNEEYVKYIIEKCGCPVSDQNIPPSTNYIIAVERLRKILIERQPKNSTELEELVE